MRAGSLCQGFATGFQEAFHLAPVLELVNLVRVLQGVTQADICLQYAIPKAFVGQGLFKGLKVCSRQHKLIKQKPFEFVQAYLWNH